MPDPDSELTLDDVLAGGTTGGSLADLVGGNFIDPVTGFEGQLNFRKDRRTGREFYSLVREDGRAVEVKPGTNLVDPLTRLSYTTGQKFSTRSTKLSDNDLTRLFGAGAGSTRTAAQEELDRAQAAHLAEQDRLAREQLAESRRQNLLDTARRLVEAKITERTALTEQGTKLAGYDPFRLLASQHGQTVAADVRTPYDMLKDTIASRATAPLPQLGSSSTVDDLESAIGKLQQMQGGAPQGQGIGFAQGGTAQMPGPLQAHLIGEQGSYIAPGTEVLLTGNGQATVVPLGQGMAEGGSVPFDERSLTVLPQLFERLRRDTITAGGRPYGDVNSRLGFLNPGQTREPQFGSGLGARAEPLTLRPGYQDFVKLGTISQPDADRVVNLIGLLPNPRNAAAFLRNLSPTEREAVVSAYKLANVPETELDALLASATLAGPARQAVRFAA